MIKVLSLNWQDPWKIDSELKWETEPVPIRTPQHLKPGNLKRELEACNIAQDLHDRISVAAENRVVVCYEKEGVVEWREWGYGRMHVDVGGSVSGSQGGDSGHIIDENSSAKTIALARLNAARHSLVRTSTGGANGDGGLAVGRSVGTLDNYGGGNAASDRGRYLEKAGENAGDKGKSGASKAAS